MYKVFVNEKKLVLSNAPAGSAKTLQYEDGATLEMALDLLENTSCQDLNIYSDDLEALMADFRQMFRIVDAAGGIVRNAKNEILFIHRLGRWDMPKGKTEPGESLKESALREVEEETSLQELVIENFVNSTMHVYRERNGARVLKTTYWYRMNYSGEKPPVPQTEEGITQVAWKSTEQIKADVLPNTFKNIILILTEAGIINSTENL